MSDEGGPSTAVADQSEVDAGEQRAVPAWLGFIPPLLSVIRSERQRLPDDLEPYVRAAETICLRLLDAGDRDIAPSEAQTNSLKKYVTRLQGRFTRIATATLETSDDPNARSGIEAQIQAVPGEVDSLRNCAMHILFEDLIQLLPAVADLQSGLTAARSETRELAERPAEVMRELNEVLAAAKTVRSQSDQEFAAARTAMQTMLAEAGVGKFAEHFAALDRHHQDEAKTWLTRAEWFAAGAVGTIWGFFLNFAHDLIGRGIEVGIGFATLLSIFASIAVFCAKNYRAHEHNASVNKHRAVALHTFAAFRDSTTDEATKNAILALAAQCAFTGQDTGFGGGVEVVTPMVQALRAKT
jgi:hypothetical protein